VKVTKETEVREVVKKVTLELTEDEAKLLSGILNVVGYDEEDEVEDQEAPDPLLDPDDAFFALKLGRAIRNQLPYIKKTAENKN
jgi:hypothetical protein